MFESINRRVPSGMLLAGLLCYGAAALAGPQATDSPYRFRDATSVGFATGWSYPPGYAYSYGHTTYRPLPYGEFGGYLYRSPDDYLNFRGPVYQPITGVAVGLPTAGRDGRVPMDDVPLWTDEGAARVIQNRAAAGIAPNELASARRLPPVRVNQSPRAPSIRDSHRAPQPMRPIQLVPVPKPPAQNAAPSRVPRPAPSAPTPAMQPLPAPRTEAPPPVAPAHSAEAMPMAPTDSVSGMRSRDRVTPLAEPSTVGAMEEIAAEDATGQPRASAASTQSPLPTGAEDDALNRATAAGISIGRGDMAFERGEFGRARDEYLDALAVGDDEPSVRIALGLAEYAMGEYGKAAEAIRRGVAEAPDIARSEFRLQDVYGNPEDMRLHYQLLRDHVDAHSDDPDHLFLLGFVGHFSGDVEGARRAFKAYRSSTPRDDLADAFIDAVLQND